MERTVRALAPTEIQEYWPIIGPLIESSVSYAPEDLPASLVQVMLENGDAVAVIVQDGIGEINGVLVSEIIGQDERKTINCLAVAGDHGENWLQDLIRACEQAAIREGCQRVIFRGRVGWRRLMEPKGYQQTGVIMTKQLTGNYDGRH